MGILVRVQIPVPLLCFEVVLFAVAVAVLGVAVTGLGARIAFRRPFVPGREVGAPSISRFDAFRSAVLGLCNWCLSPSRIGLGGMSFRWTSH
jgi:hypothetical protein